MAFYFWSPIQLNFKKLIENLLCVKTLDDVYRVFYSFYCKQLITKLMVKQEKLLLYKAKLNCHRDVQLLVFNVKWYIRMWLG